MRRVERADRLHMPTGARFADRGEVGGAIIGVPDCDHTSVDVRCQGVDRIEDRLRDTAGFVDDHQDVPRVDALESSRVIVSRLSAVGDQLVAYVPLGVERDCGPADLPSCERCSCIARESPRPAESSERL